jgi:adenylate kinase family enzyme
MRLAILGNSGSGKSTLARWAAQRMRAPSLDLDTVAWEPGQIAVARPAEVARADVAAFCGAHASWVVEGCYASLIEVTLRFGPRLVLLNPGREQCLANCRTRPWEPHKYVSREAQQEQLAFLLDWVGEYYTRDGDLSLGAHRALFDAYSGNKLEVLTQPTLAPASAELLAWLD